LQASRTDEKNRLGGLSGHTHLGGVAGVGVKVRVGGWGWVGFGWVAGVGFVEERPDTRLDSLPAGQLTAVKLLVQSKPQPLVTLSCPSSQPYTAAPGPAGRAHALPPDPLVAPGGASRSSSPNFFIMSSSVGLSVSRSSRSSDWRAHYTAPLITDL